MLALNLKQAVKRLVDDVRLGIPDEVILEQLKYVTTAEWAGVGKRALENTRPSVELMYEHGDSTEDDFIVGIYGDRIVSIYTIRGWERTDDGRRVVFRVAPARAEMAAAVGQPTPGGPWKRGEGRPIRYFDTQAFLRELRSHNPAMADYQEGDVERRMVEVIRALAGPAPSVSPLEGVVVETDSRGGIRVTVPMGTKVTIVQRDE